MMKLDKEEKARLARCIETWLGVDGLAFFRKIYEEHGKLCVCLLTETAAYNQRGDLLMLPHPVHLREGMSVRNELRRLTDCAWTAHEYDNLWEEITLAAIGVGGNDAELDDPNDAGYICSSLPPRGSGPHKDNGPARQARRAGEERQ